MACNGDGLSRQMASKKAMIRFYVSALGSFITAMRESTGGKKKKKVLASSMLRALWLQITISLCLQVAEGSLRTWIPKHRGSLGLPSMTICRLFALHSSLLHTAFSSCTCFTQDLLALGIQSSFDIVPGVKRRECNFFKTTDNTNSSKHIVSFRAISKEVE